MKTVPYFLLLIMVIAFISCEKVSEDAVKLSVEYSWEGLEPCGWGNPEIHISGIPEKTKNLKIIMYDHEYSHKHGTVITPYSGENTITKNRFKKIQGPCPPNDPGEYEITIKAIDENEIVIGKGSKTRFFPEKK